MSNTQLRNLLLALVAIVAAIGGVLLIQQRLAPRKDLDAKKDTRASEKDRDTVFLNRDDAAGIEAERVMEVEWHPRLFVDGRVVPNPHATLEVRAPFAGVLVVDENTPLPGLGSAIKPRQVLARFKARYNAFEKLDMLAKKVEADKRLEGAERVLKINQEKFDRLEKIPSGGISPANRDAALIQLVEARTQMEIALAQRTLWQQALERSGDKSMIVALEAPIRGEIAEVAAQPGGNVEMGQLIVRIVDFSRVLVRLDFPVNNTDAPPPENIDVETLSAPLAKDAPVRWRAHLRGPAANVEIPLQKTGYLYDIVPLSQGLAPNWRPGLYVKASVPDPARKKEEMIAIPSAALLVHKGFQCVYIKQNAVKRVSKDQNEKTYVPFKRLEVTVLDRVGDLVYFDATGWEQYADFPVVTAGAQRLLSEEFRSDVDDD